MTTTNNLKTLTMLAAALAVLTAASLSMAARPADAAATFTVNNTTDPGNGVCDSAGCSLREAITAANDASGADTIDFAIPGTGVKTIRPDSQLPSITEAVTIDGYTQTGASPNTLTKGTNARLMIELDGSDAGSFAKGLTIPASNVVVRGLVINRFYHDGINTEINGTTTGIKIEGNFIGTDPSGTLDLGNSGRGVRIEDTSNATVGGTSPEARNLLSGNGSAGISLLSSNTEVAGNLIGTKKDGIKPLPNSGSGVEIVGVSENVVGGTAAGAANTIAFNGGDGIRVVNGSGTGSGNGILSNSVFSNGEEGIDLGGDGPTANDPGDADIGSNNLQNFPVITSAKTSRKSTTIKANLNSTPSGTFVVRFFSNPKGDAEGKKLMGQKSVATDASGDASFVFKAKKVRGGTVTDTATNDSTGDTSEFSAPRKVRRV